ncbi:MAG TPA: rhamnulokinase family protein [Gemmatales bacterium]|nr:rhamnulokinase family protein [Gemmatales bacterium]
MAERLLAFDLGAESGRALLGTLTADGLAVEVLHRFPNGPVRVGAHLYWDVLRLWSEMKDGLARAAATGPLASVGVDSWGVDIALLGRGGVLLGNPRHYRDPHTETIQEEVLARVPAADIFAATGLQFMRFNTLFQLLALQRDRSPLLEETQTLLMIPDLFHHWLGGTLGVEVTNASTTQCLDPRSATWATGLLERVGLPCDWFGPLVPPGTRIGELRGDLAAESGLGPVPIVAPATHDTAAAVVGTPGTGTDWCFLSSGTWSLMGVELPEPVITPAVQQANFTNELGYGGTTRFLKNVMGLWLVQECRRAWQREGHDFSYEELARLAEAAPAHAALVDPDHASFMLPASMPAALAEFCRQSHQPIPTTPGGFIRCALESLALRYRWVVDQLEQLTGRTLRVIHVVGGGSQNRLLNQLTADATGRLVLAGPVEATGKEHPITQTLGPWPAPPPTARQTPRPRRRPRLYSPVVSRGTLRTPQPAELD